MRNKLKNETTCRWFATMYALHARVSSLLYNKNPGDKQEPDQLHNEQEALTATGYIWLL